MQPQNPKIHNPIAKEAMRDLERRKNQLKESFAGLVDGNVRQIPEGIFVRDFLPLFSGQKVENRVDLLSAWYLIAGTPFIPVNVMDTLGQVVIQIPPVHENQLFTDQHKGDTMGVAMEEAKQLSAMSPRMGDNVLGKALSERMVKVTTPKKASPAWEAVFAHYGVTKAGGSAAPASPEGESDFEM